MPPLGVGTVDRLFYGPAEALWFGMHREAPGQMLGVCGSMEKAFAVGSSEYSRHVAARGTLSGVLLRMRSKVKM